MNEKSDHVVIRQFIVQQRIMENWYNLKPIWDHFPSAEDHLEECRFHMPDIEFRMIERIIIETVV